MLSEFKYCPIPDADVPKMFIDKQIGGKDADGNPGIDGNLFMKELLCLSDEMGKKNIEVWINSEGGYVQEGQSIYTGILHSKAKVDTVCYGLAASIAGVIFQAGRKRIMLDYANLMYHPGYNEDGSEDKGLAAINESLAVMISTRTGNTLDQVKALMNAGKPKEDKGTWISAPVADTMGFCDDVWPSDEVNLKRMAAIPTTTDKWQFANKILNSLKNDTPKTKSMKQVCNKLGLNDEANEASVVRAIEDMQVKNKASMEELNAKLAKKNEEMDTLNKEMTALKNEMEEDKKAKAKAEEEAKATAEVKVKADAKTEVTNAVATGRIKNDADLIKKWEDKLVKNFADTKELLDAIAPTRAGAKFTPAAATNYGSTLDAGTKAELELNGIKFGSMEYENALALKKVNKQ